MVVYFLKFYNEFLLYEGKRFLGNCLSVILYSLKNNLKGKEKVRRNSE